MLCKLFRVTAGLYVCVCVCACVCVCVCFPTTSIQQRRISGPDVYDLWSGRSCSGEASNVLNIISHRWSRVRTQQCSHTSGLGRRLSSLFTMLFLHMCASRPFVRLQIASHPPLTLLLLFQRDLPVWTGWRLGAIWLWNGTRPTGWWM